MTVVAGVDIGGTKCAVSIANAYEGGFTLLGRDTFLIPYGYSNVIEKLIMTLKNLLNGRPDVKLSSIGISCGGPLDSRTGTIYSPPNLPGWDSVDIISPFQDAFQVPVGLQNDANACALAEWQWGAGQGAQNMVFLTFGTGMGAGLILNGQLYTGRNDMAGEIGHIRLADHGPVGYGKEGSFEGFCSGGGIARLAQDRLLSWLSAGKPSLLCNDIHLVTNVTARDVGIAAENGDALAISVMETSADFLGRGLAMLVDMLNPEKIIIGSIYIRQRALLEPIALATMRREALSRSVSQCQITPAGLGEEVGDYAGLAVAGSLLLPK